MRDIFFQPWIGKKYQESRLLILSESAYSWDANGKTWDPGRSHPKRSLCHWIKHLEKRTYFSSMSKALCGAERPTTEQALRAWSECAYTIYVPKTVGIGARTRPSSEQWQEARLEFLRLIEKMRPQPLKIVVTGFDMWNRHMPGCTGPHLDDFRQSYKLSNGNLVWCLAIPHPANTRQGFRWKEIGDRIRQFRAAKFQASA
jgi:hypothetical protein